MSAGLTIDDILRDIVARPGCAVGLSFPELKRIWESICVQCFHTVAQRKTLMIPNFCHFYFSSSSMVQAPQFIFSPNFSSMYGVSILQPQLSRVTHNSTPCPSLTLNLSAAAVHAGVTRDSVNNTLKDIIRRVGEVVLHGKGGSMCCLEFIDLCKVMIRRGGRYDVHWTSKALQHIATVYASSSSRIQTPNRTERGAELLVKRGTPTLPRETEDAAVVVDVSQQQGSKPWQQLRPASAPATNRSLPTQQAPENPSESRTPPTQAPDDTAEVFESQTSSPAPPQKRAGLPPSKYLLHKSHKAKVRRGRQETYVDSWENQLARKREQQDREFKAAVLAQEQSQTHLALEEEKDRLLRRDARSQEMKVRDVNQALQRARQTSQMPRSHQMGSIFTGRICTHSVPPDLKFLSRQMHEHEDRKRAERQEDVRCAHRLVEYDRQLLEAERQRRLDLKAQLRRDQEEHLKMVETTSSDKGMLRVGEWDGDMFFANLSPEARKEEERRQKRVDQEEAKKLQQFNMDVVRQRELQAQRNRQEQRNELRNTSREAIAQEGVQRAHRLRVARSIQNELATAWDVQVNEKRRVNRAEGKERKEWRDASYWTNASSDDEM